MFQRKWLEKLVNFLGKIKAKPYDAEIGVIFDDFHKFLAPKKHFYDIRHFLDLLNFQRSFLLSPIDSLWSITPIYKFSGHFKVKNIPPFFVFFSF